MELEVKRVRGKWCIVCGRHSVQEFKSDVAAYKALHNNGELLYACVLEGASHD